MHDAGHLAHTGKARQRAAEQQGSQDVTRHGQAGGPGRAGIFAQYSQAMAKAALREHHCEDQRRSQTRTKPRCTVTPTKLWPARRGVGESWQPGTAR